MHLISPREPIQETSNDARAKPFGRKWIALSAMRSSSASSLWPSV